MINEKYQDRPAFARFVTLPSVTPALAAGAAVLVGKEAGVLMDNFDSNRGGATVRFSGTFALTVIGQSVASPQTTHQINPGDPIYAAGTLDSTTNVTYNLTLDAASGGTLFGSLDPEQAHVAAGATNTSAWVRLKEQSL